jgi:hypothetical protein
MSALSRLNAHKKLHFLLSSTANISANIKDTEIQLYGK